MKKAYAKHSVPTMLEMLQHPHSTQPNEALNHSVGTIAPKTKTFSKSSSLLTRVNIIGATQVVGNYRLWMEIFASFRFKLDPNLSRRFRKKDENKSTRQILQKQKSINHIEQHIDILSSQQLINHSKRSSRQVRCTKVGSQ